MLRIITKNDAKQLAIPDPDPKDCFGSGFESGSSSGFEFEFKNICNKGNRITKIVVGKQDYIRKFCCYS